MYTHVFYSLPFFHTGGGSSKILRRPSETDSITLINPVCFMHTIIDNYHSMYIICIQV